MTAEQHKIFNVFLQYVQCHQQLQCLGGDAAAATGGSKKVLCPLGISRKHPILQIGSLFKDALKVL